jgi:hypothetical protein
VTEQGQTRGPRGQRWVQDAVVKADTLQLQLQSARQRALSGHQKVVVEGISTLIDRVREATRREDSVRRRLVNWWQGTQVEAAYLNLHAAKVQMVDVYEEGELRAEIPGRLARAQQTFRADDPRLTAAERLMQNGDLQSDVTRPALRNLISDSYAQADREYAQIRSFRNIVLMSALALYVLVVAIVGVVALKPHWLPLCFALDGHQACPTSSGPTGPRGADIVIVALLGAAGGAVGTLGSIRNLKGTSTPYDIPAAVATLKIPLGALTAILAVAAISANLVPGLSYLDSRGQILAFALVFGFAGQALARPLDRRGQILMEVPGGTTKERTPMPTVPTSPAAKSSQPFGTANEPATQNWLRRLVQSRGRPAWAARVQHEVDRLRADLATARIARKATATDPAIDPSRLESIEKDLNEAEKVVEQHFQRGLTHRLIGASSAYQQAMASVYRASEDLWLVQSDAALAARLPYLRAAVRSYLSSDDPRRELYLLRIDAALTTIGAARLAVAGSDAARSTAQPRAEAQEEPAPSDQEQAE